MSRIGNDALAELIAMGLIEGVITTVKGGKVTVSAGSVSVTADNDDEAFTKLRDKVKALPAKDRPKAWESTTRTTADPNLTGLDREVRAVTKEDF